MSVRIDPLRYSAVHRQIRTVLCFSSPAFPFHSQKTAVLPVVVHGYETWSVTLKEECGLRVYENMVLRRIFGPERDEVTGYWRRQRDEELHDLSFCQTLNGDG